MKKMYLKTTLLCAIAALAMVLPAFAGNFYVCSGTSFTLKPDVSTITYTTYEWTDGASTVLQTGATANYTTTVTLATATTAEAKTYRLRVQNSDGCWSDLATHTVYVLPQLTASITGSTEFCAGVTITGNLSATTNHSTLDLTAAPGTGYNFSWTGGTGSVASGTNNNTYSLTTAGAYDVSVAYTLPANDGSKLSSCNGTASHTVTVLTAPTTPVVVIE